MNEIFFCTKTEGCTSSISSLAHKDKKLCLGKKECSFKDKNLNTKENSELYSCIHLSQWVYNYILKFYDEIFY